MLTKPQAIKLILGLIIAIVGIMGITPKAYAADAVLGNDQEPLVGSGVIWTGVNTGYLFIYFNDGVDHGFYWSKTTNGGVTFSTPTEIIDLLGTSVCSTLTGDIFFDRWVPNLTTSYIHIVLHYRLGTPCSTVTDSIERYYRFDTTNDTIDISQVDTTAGVCTTGCASQAHTISRAANGYLYWSRVMAGSLTNSVRSSTNDGTTWSGIADPPCRMTHLFPVQGNEIFLIDDQDIAGFCPTFDGGNIVSGDFYIYNREVNVWGGSRYEYVPNYGTDTVICDTNRALDQSSGRYYLVVSGSIGGACFDTNTWADSISHNSTTFRETNIYTGITGNGVNSNDALFSATEDNLYVFLTVEDGLDDDVVFYVSEDDGQTFTGPTLFDSEEENRTHVYLADGLSASGGWIYPIWRNNTADTYDTNLLAIFAQLPVFDFPGENPPEEILQGYSEFLGTWLFVAVVAGSIFFMHIIWRWPYELMYPIGLICGAILGHPTVAIIESWWVIAAVALIAAIYIYRLILAPDTSSDGG